MEYSSYLLLNLKHFLWQKWDSLINVRTRWKQTSLLMMSPNRVNSKTYCGTLEFYPDCDKWCFGLKFLKTLCLCSTIWLKYLVLNKKHSKSSFAFKFENCCFIFLVFEEVTVFIKQITLLYHTSSTFQKYCCCELLNVTN